MTKNEAIRWLQLDIAMMKFDPSTGEDAYLNDDAKKTIEALDMAIDALRNEQKAEELLLKSDPDSVSNDDVVYRQLATILCSRIKCLSSSTDLRGERDE